jgi:(2R)-sulfolactate sulfo-lyase subunit alpha
MATQAKQDPGGSRGQRASPHKFLIHKRGDHVGVATSDIAAGEAVVGIYMDDDSTTEVTARADIPLGHKIAVEPRHPSDQVLEYGIAVGIAPKGFEPGEYVHVHNLKSARW